VRIEAFQQFRPALGLRTSGLFDVLQQPLQGHAQDLGNNPMVGFGKRTLGCFVAMHARQSPVHVAPVRVSQTR